MDEWPIVMYGVNINDLDPIMSIEDFQDMLISNDKVNAKMSDNFLSWSLVDDDIYIGIVPRYPWDTKIPYKTEAEAKNAIADFVEPYVFNPRKVILNYIDNIETVGWG